MNAGSAPSTVWMPPYGIQLWPTPLAKTTTLGSRPVTVRRTEVPEPSSPT